MAKNPFGSSGYIRIENMFRLFRAPVLVDTLGEKFSHTGKVNATIVQQRLSKECDFCTVAVPS